MLPQLQMLDNMCTAGKNGDRQVQSNSYAIIAAHNAVAGCKIDDTVEQSCVQQASNSRTAANMLVASAVKHVGAKPDACSAPEPALHIGDQWALQTTPDCNVQKATRPRRAHNSLELLTPSPDRPGYHVFKAVIHLLEELERGRDWNTLMAVNVDLQHRLDGKVKQALPEQWKQQ